MNVYDFDNTIFDGDSSLEFLKFIVKKNPLAFKENFLSISLEIIKYKIFNNDLENFKEKAFSLIKYLPDIDLFINEFWENNLNRIKNWYLVNKKDDDVIISASPEFLLKPIASRLNVNLIATEMNLSGNIMGINNKGNEKIARFKKKFPNANIDNFYSDSLDDTPLAIFADNAYLVKGNSIKDWPK